MSDHGSFHLQSKLRLCSEYSSVSARYGSGIGALNGYTKTGSNAPSKKWSDNSGDKGDKWIIGVFEVQENAEFSVIFEGNF